MPHKKFPSQLAKLLWFQKNPDIEQDKNAIIHHVLALGTLEDWKALFALYPISEIRENFKQPAKGLYDPAVLKLCEKILDIKVPSAEKYIKNIYGNKI